MFTNIVVAGGARQRVHAAGCAARGALRLFLISYQDFVPHVMLIELRRPPFSYQDQHQLLLALTSILLALGAARVDVTPCSRTPSPSGGLCQLRTLNANRSTPAHAIAAVRSALTLFLLKLRGVLLKVLRCLSSTSSLSRRG